MTENKTSWVFELYDKVSSTFITMDKNMKGFQAGLIKMDSYLQDLGSRFVRFNALSDGFARMNQNFKDAIEPGMEFEQQMADLEAITGITGKDLDSLGETARKMGKDTGLGAAGAAEAYKLLASAIDISTIGGVDGLNKLQKATITLAQASGVDMPTAANTMANTINQFKLKAEDASKVINILGAGAKYGAAEIPDLAESLKQAGATAGAAGVSIEQTVGALEILSQSGIKAGDAGSDLRNIIVRLQTQLGIDVGKIGLPAALQMLAPKLSDVTFLSKNFGVENLKSVQTLLSHADAVGEMTDKITGTKVAEEQAAIRTRTRRVEMEKIKAAMDDMKISLFNLTGGMAPYIEVMTTGFVTISQSLPLLTLMKDGFMFLTNAQKMSVVWTKIATAAQWAWNIAMDANPIGLIIAGVAALVGGIIIAWNKLEGFRKFMYSMWEVIKTIGEGLWDIAKGVGQLFSFHWSSAMSSFKDGIGKFTSIGNAWAEGQNRGAVSWAKSKSETAESTPADAGFTYYPDGKKPNQTDLMKQPKDKSDGDGSGGSGGGKNITINFENRIENINVASNDLVKVIKEELQRQLLTMLNDANLAAAQ